jgi:hypothetical protein
MGQTSRFIEALYQERENLAQSERAVLDNISAMSTKLPDAEHASHLFFELRYSAEQVCRHVWLNIEPELKKEHSELLGLISDHISQILLCEWEKWQFRSTVNDSSKSDGD